MNKNISVTFPIVLVGMMGSGKSTIGRKLAQSMGLDFFDSDKLISENEKMSIPDIFQNKGETYFRTLEYETIRGIVLERNGCVLSTGGGAILNHDLRGIIKKNAMMIWLDADLDVLFKRVSKDKNRPLLQTPDPRQTLENLMIKRKDLYAQAHFRVDTSIKNEEKVMQDIFSAIEQYKKENMIG